MLSLPSPASPGNSRISVNYLLSGSPRIPHRSKQAAPSLFSSPLIDLRLGIEESEEALFYGYDHGIRDADINQNDDPGAILQTTTSATYVASVTGGTYGDAFSQVFDTGHNTTSGGGYYNQPVPIWIPRNIEPLPPK